MPDANPYKQLKPVSRQALTNFVNLKSNTIMKKPQYKSTDLFIRATAPKFLLKYVLWHKSLKYFKKSCVIGE